jgi:aspartyl-tRNA(Asn)/glutamyl-tRNA(Gln) amidotransferase subunit C
MASQFTREDVKAIAALASLELSEAEIDVFVLQLGQILAYAGEVQRVDTSGVAPTASVVTRHEVDRDDTPQPCLDREQALANAPDASAGGEFFRVPRVIG